jgi:solute carrier family 25 protein 39/40
MHAETRFSQDAFIKITRREGLASLWRGLPPSLLMQVPATTMYFSVYEKLKGKIQGSAGSYSPLIAGAAARMLVVFLTSPFDLFRTNLQSHNRNVGSLDILKFVLFLVGFLAPSSTNLTNTLLRDFFFKNEIGR